MTLSRGIDVSHHQGAINWDRIKRELGLTWGVCKATEGDTFTDSYFTRNWSGMKSAGLVRVAYHFARPEVSSGATQAKRFLSVVKPQKSDVVCLDLEASKLTQAQTNAWAKDFGNTLRREVPGIATWLYLGGYAANGTGSGLSHYFDFWWYPRYATMNPVKSWPTVYAPRLKGNTTGWKAPHIWQWAASLSTSEGLVDANISPLTAEQLNNPSAAIPEEDMPTTDEIVKAVLAAPVRVGNEMWPLGQAVGRAAAYARANGVQLDAATDPNKLAAVVAKALEGKGPTVTHEQLVAALVDTFKQLTEA